jgi:hypothetical protein
LPLLAIKGWKNRKKKIPFRLQLPPPINKNNIFLFFIFPTVHVNKRPKNL